MVYLAVKIQWIRQEEYNLLNVNVFWVGGAWLFPTLDGFCENQNQMR